MKFPFLGAEKKKTLTVTITLQETIIYSTKRKNGAVGMGYVREPKENYVTVIAMSSLLNYSFEILGKKIGKTVASWEVQKRVNGELLISSYRQPDFLRSFVFFAKKNLWIASSFGRRKDFLGKDHQKPFVRGFLTN